MCLNQCVAIALSTGDDAKINTAFITIQHSSTFFTQSLDPVLGASTIELVDQFYTFLSITGMELQGVSQLTKMHVFQPQVVLFSDNHHLPHTYTLPIHSLKCTCLRQ